MSRAVIAADLGGTKILAGLVGPRGNVLAERRVPVTAGGPVLVRQLVSVVQDLRQSAPPGTAISGIGVAVPGAVRADATVWAPNISGWRNVHLADHLARATGLRATVRDDRLTSLLGEAWLGEARRARSAVFLTIGTGIGVGFLADGRFWTGAHGVSGSVGWWALGGSRPAGASRIGTLEAQVGGPAIRARMRRGRIQGTTAQDLVAAARRNVPGARALLADVGRTIGLLIANLISVLDPEVLVVGGGILQAGGFPLAQVRRVVRAHTQPLARGVRIRRSTLGVRASFLGAAALVYRPAIRGGDDALIS